MGNIGLEPEITREFLEKEYRSACETIARLTAENEHLRSQIGPLQNACVRLLDAGLVKREDGEVGMLCPAAFVPAVKAAFVAMKEGSK